MPPVGTIEILSGGWQQCAWNCFFVFSFYNVESLVFLCDSRTNWTLADVEFFVELNSWIFDKVIMLPQIKNFSPGGKTVISKI